MEHSLKVKKNTSAVIVTRSAIAFTLKKMYSKLVSHKGKKAFAEGRHINYIMMTTLESLSISQTIYSNLESNCAERTA